MRILSSSFWEWIRSKWKCDTTDCTASEEKFTWNKSAGSHFLSIKRSRFIYFFSFWQRELDKRNSPDISSSPVKKTGRHRLSPVKRMDTLWLEQKTYKKKRNLKLGVLLASLESCLQDNKYHRKKWSHSMSWASCSSWCLGLSSWTKRLEEQTSITRRIKLILTVIIMEVDTAKFIIINTSILITNTITDSK